MCIIVTDMADPAGMTDHDLLEERAAWDCDRATRWARVEALSGPAFLVARDAYMVLKARADAVAAELQRRGVRRRVQTVDRTTRKPSHDFRL